jgi:hypothetical protein
MSRQVGHGQVPLGRITGPSPRDPENDAVRSDTLNSVNDTVLEWTIELELPQALGLFAQNHNLKQYKPSGCGHTEACRSRLGTDECPEPWWAIE